MKASIIIWAPLKKSPNWASQMIRLWGSSKAMPYSNERTASSERILLATSSFPPLPPGTALIISLIISETINLKESCSHHPVHLMECTSRSFYYQPALHADGRTFRVPHPHHSVGHCDLGTWDYLQQIPKKLKIWKLQILSWIYRLPWLQRLPNLSLHPRLASFDVLLRAFSADVGERSIDTNNKIK